MDLTPYFESLKKLDREKRSRSAQGLSRADCSLAAKIPLPPRLWISDVSDESSDDSDSSKLRDDGFLTMERNRWRSRFRHHKQRSGANVPIGIFWDIENCQVPRGCSAIDIVAAIRAKFLTGRREAEFVVVCDVRKESPAILQDLNDAQVNLIHVCGTQKNAADEKLRQCMRRFAELHTAPAALLLISGDINFAADLSDLRHRKNMEVILVHKQNTSSALIACASSHYCYYELTANLPRKPKTTNTGETSCEMEVVNLPTDQPPDRLSKRLRRLADNCGGKVLRVTAPTATLKFPSPDHVSRALKRMDGEDVFGRKISTRYARSIIQPTVQAYSSDEGYGTAHTNHPTPKNPNLPPPIRQLPAQPQIPSGGLSTTTDPNVASEWALALQQLPAPTPTPPPLDFSLPALPAPKPRKIRGTHGSVNLDRSGCSSSNSGDESRQRENSQSRTISPWNSSASFSEQSSESELESAAELTVSNLPPYEPGVLQDMLIKLFRQYVPVLRVSVWFAGEGPQASVMLRSEWDARLVIARVHKRRLENLWTGRRLELSIGKPSPAPTVDVLKARLKAILIGQKFFTMPLLQLRDTYASRHCCTLTTSDILKVKDTVMIQEGFGRMVQLVDLTPMTNTELNEAPWKCHIHAGTSATLEDGSRILQPVYIQIAVLAKNTQMLLESHGGVLPLLSFVECYEAIFPPLVVDPRRGVPLELLLRSVSALEVKDSPSRHITWRQDRTDTPPLQSGPSESSHSSGERERLRTAPILEPMLALFERELVDLLRTTPRCTIPFGKLIPAFHHHFGRQCRVADYGFTKLPDLLAVLSGTIMVLGSGSSRVITLSAAAQTRRWTTDLVKLLKAQPGRAILPRDVAELYQTTFGRPFSPVDYGVCTLHELMDRVAPQAVLTAADGALSLPRRVPTREERVRTSHFALQAVELLCYTPNLRMEFSRFVPAYHAHFGRQLRVAHYGCVKLIELFESIPETVTVHAESGGERTVHLAPRLARGAVASRLRALAPVTFGELATAYAAQFGGSPSPDMLGVNSLEALVYAAGGCLEGGAVRPPGSSARWVTAELAACAALSSDRSVAVRGSTEEYFATAFRRLCVDEPDVRSLAAAGVIVVAERHIRLTPAWRTVWRVAQILADRIEPLPLMELYVEYTERYNPLFPYADLGFESVVEFLRYYSEVFVERDTKWSLCAGVAVPRYRDHAIKSEDYSMHDTPPGQKGSRVFESPRSNVWCSPPASALPTPTALLTHENRRRTRLAAQFDAV